MKKIILIIILLLLCSCYDYKEVNDLSFVSTIGIDKHDDYYKITFEILSDTSSAEDTIQSKAYSISEDGKTIEQAFDNITLKINKIPYYYHLKSVVISEEIAKEDLQEISEYIIRNPEIRNEFYLLVAKDVSAEKVLNSQNDSHPIVGDELAKLITTSIHSYSTAYDNPFEDMLERFSNKRIDPVTTVCTLDDNEIKILGIGLFDDYHYIDVLEEKESALLNILLKSRNNLTLNKNQNSINIYKTNTSYKVKDNCLFINISCIAEINTIDEDINLKDNKTYIKLGNEFNSILSKDIINLINVLKEKDVDPLGISNYYYKKGINKEKNIYDNLNIKVNVNVNKKGLIFNLYER